MGLMGPSPNMAGLLLPVAAMAPRHTKDAAMAEFEVQVRAVDAINVAVPALGPLRRVEEPVTLLVGGHGLHGPETALVTPRDVGHAAAACALFRGAGMPEIGPAVVATVRVGVPEGPTPAGAATGTSTGDAPPRVGPCAPEGRVTPTGLAMARARLLATTGPVVEVVTGRVAASRVVAIARPVGRPAQVVPASAPVRCERVATNAVGQTGAPAPAGVPRPGVLGAPRPFLGVMGATPAGARVAVAARPSEEEMGGRAIQGGDYSDGQK